MKANLQTKQERSENWQFAKPLAELKQRKAMLARVSGKQIALFETVQGVHACDNRCPHEGFPLSEGDVSGECTLTCNWHNWKFDLSTGENLYGGDKLRTYPVDIRGDQIWVDITDPPYAQRYDAIVRSLHDAFDDHEYDRIAREIARLKSLGADPLDCLRLAIEWSWQRMHAPFTRIGGR
jgi:nitrite reductase/ring-hydroxylating ferredoxin subunit